jgi:8-oxo-dGTP pyrophosphatase MutT (NUDIX family)
VPHRKYFINLLENYTAYNQLEHQALQACISFVKNNSHCFMRTNLSGHITASCWLVSPDQERVLLTHHKKIGKWLQLGGHNDGDADPMRVALREAEEESGIAGIKILSDHIFDIDVHTIAQYKETPEHLHYDIRFALQAPHENFLVSSESHALAWLPITELVSGPITNNSLTRMARKWLCQKNNKK